MVTSQPHYMRATRDLTWRKRASPCLTPLREYSTKPPAQNPLERRCIGRVAAVQRNIEISPPPVKPILGESQLSLQSQDAPHPSIPRFCGLLWCDSRKFGQTPAFTRGSGHSPSTFTFATFVKDHQSGFVRRPSRSQVHPLASRCPGRSPAAVASSRAAGSRLPPSFACTWAGARRYRLSRISP